MCCWGITGSLCPSSTTNWGSVWWVTGGRMSSLDLPIGWYVQISCECVCVLSTYLHMKHLNQSLGDLFAQPKAAGVFMPGLPTPTQATLGSPPVSALRDSYQNRGKGHGHGTQVSIPSTENLQEPLEHDGVGDGYNSQAGNRFVDPPTPPMLQPVVTPTGTPNGTPIARPKVGPKAPPAPPALVQPAPKNGQPQHSQPANPPSIYENGVYWKLLGWIYALACFVTSLPILNLGSLSGICKAQKIFWASEWKELCQQRGVGDVQRQIQKNHSSNIFFFGIN